MQGHDGLTGLLGPIEKGDVFRHACERFPTLVPVGATGLDDLAFLDHQAARPWYGRVVEGSRSFSSTGTSGYPKRVAWTPDEDAWYVGEKQDLFAPWLKGCARGFISLAVGHNAGSARSVLESLGLEVHDAGLSALADQCAVITEFAPDVLYCSPSILDNLLVGLHRRGERPASVRRIITNGEVLFPSARARAESYFGIGQAGVMDTYGSTEIGTIAYSCGDCAAFHFMDGLYPEAAPAELAHSEDDLVGVGSDTVVLVVSSVKRTSFPVVRFVTYDVVRGLRRSVCGGVRRFTCDRILGRCDDVLNYGELFSSYDLGDLIGSHLPGARWFVFNPRNDLTIVVEGVEPAGFREELRNRYPLHSRMSDLGLLDPPQIRFVCDFDVFVARVGLPSTHRGKAGRRVQRLAPEPSWFEEPAG
jgi:phenylacetate-coenzyme A ligase PaaK-like adenylate-forming protein